MDLYALSRKVSVFGSAFLSISSQCSSIKEGAFEILDNLPDPSEVSMLPPASQTMSVSLSFNGMIHVHAIQPSKLKVSG